MWWRSCWRAAPRWSCHRPTNYHRVVPDVSARSGPTLVAREGCCTAAAKGWPTTATICRRSAPSADRRDFARTWASAASPSDWRTRLGRTSGSVTRTATTTRKSASLFVPTSANGLRSGTTSASASTPRRRSPRLSDQIWGNGWRRFDPILEGARRMSRRAAYASYFASWSHSLRETFFSSARVSCSTLIRLIDLPVTLNPHNIQADTRGRKLWQGKELSLTTIVFS